MTRSGYSRTPRPCSVPECGSRFARLYPCGWRCAEHAPVPAGSTAA